MCHLKQDNHPSIIYQTSVLRVCGQTSCIRIIFWFFIWYSGSNLIRAPRQDLKEATALFPNFLMNMFTPKPYNPKPSKLMNVLKNSAVLMRSMLSIIYGRIICWFPSDPSINKQGHFFYDLMKQSKPSGLTETAAHFSTFSGCSHTSV